jgi:hypothetical protein
MFNKNLKNLAFYLGMLTLMLVALSSFDFSKVTVSAASCCSFGVDCSKTTTCCNAYVGQAACSAAKTGYCRRVCNTYPD